VEALVIVLQAAGMFGASAAELQGIASILQIGFSGFAFLMAGLTFRIIQKEQEKEKPNQSIIRFVSNFMGYTVVLAVLVLGFLAFQEIKRADEEQRIRREHSAQVTGCRTALERVSAGPAEGLSPHVQEVLASCTAPVQAIERAGD
jgi:hypothetical protein